MNTNNSDSFQQNNFLERYHTLHSIYEDVFDFLIFSLAEMINTSFCTITLIEDNEEFVIACNDTEIKKVWTVDHKIDIQTLSKDEILDKVALALNKPNIKFFETFPIFDEQGKLKGRLSFFDEKEKVLNQHENKIINQSIQQIKKWIAIKAKEQQLNKHDNLFQLSNDLIGIASFGGNFVKINPAFSEILGWSDEEFLNNYFFHYIFEEDVEQTHQVMEKLKEGNSVQNFINRFHTKEGGLKWIEWTCTPELETNSVYVIGRNVTESVNNEKLLKKSEQKFHNLFNNISGILSILDLKGNFLEVNPAGLLASGYSKDEIKETTLYDLVAPERHSKIKEYIDNVLKEGKAAGEMSIIKKSGERAIWYFMSVLSEDAEGNQRISANVVDITQQKKIDFELKRAKEAAEEANKAKSEFVANMSHEIRTPLNGIIGFTDLALKTDLDETQRQYLEIINQSGVSLYAIINDILDFSKMDSSNMKLSIEKVEMEEVISEAINIVSYGMEKKGLEVLLDIDHHIPKYIWMDPMRLKQILVNLLGNALKFTEKGEITLYAHQLEDFGHGHLSLRFGVKDTGIGIPKDKQQYIFKPFTQEDGSITKKYGGTGLGLTISNNLLALANSQLQLNSEHGIGSDFFFDLKVKSETEVFENNFSNIKKVLIVDDNDNNRMILKRMLEIKNIEVEEVNSGLKALLLLSENPQFDVIIMDYHMPIMDGIETIKKIKEIQQSQETQDNEPPFIVLYSSSDDEQLQNACEELDIQTRLVKPVRMNQMYKVLGELKNTVQKPIDTSVNSTESTELQIKVLIAEDNNVNMVLTKIFTKQMLPHAILIEAKDGEEAVMLYEKEQPDIIFMDIQMPKINGFEATRMIRELEKSEEIPIIALTAGSLPGEKEKCLAAGMNDFLAKPLLLTTFSEMLEKWLGSKIRA